MADDFSSKLGGKKLSALRVVDLKLELEKRGLSKCGSKKELTDRLRQQLQLEKVHEETTSNEDCVPKLALDDATGQNEFVKQYLAEQQKIYAKQKEARRQVELGTQKTDSPDVEEVKLSSKEVNNAGANKEDSEDKCDEQLKDSSPFRDIHHADSCEGNEVMPSLPSEDLLTAEVPVEHQEKSKESGCPGPPEEQTNITMEPTSYSMVEYSLADIQLPDSPGKSKGNESQAEKQNTDEHPKDTIVENNNKNIDTVIEKEAQSNKPAKSGSYSTSKIEMKHTGVHIKIEMPKTENHITHDKQVDKSHHRSSRNRKECPVISKPDKKESIEVNKKTVTKSELSAEKIEETSKEEKEVKDTSADVVNQNKEENGYPQPKEINEEKSLSILERLKTDEMHQIISEEKLLNSTAENRSSENDSIECSENAENKISSKSEAVSPITEDKLSVEFSDVTKKAEDESEINKNEKPQLMSEDKNEEKQDEVTGVAKNNKSEDKETAKVRKFSISSHSSRSYSNDSSSSDSSPERKSAHHRNFAKSKDRKDSHSASSPRSSRSKSTSESESDKKPTRENSEEKNFPKDTAKSQNHRRKINRNISIKSTENASKTVSKDEANSVKNRSVELRMALEAMEADHKVVEEKHPKEAEVRVIKFTPRKLSLTSLKNSKAEDSSEEQKTGTKKRKWGSSTTPLPKASLSISTDSLKTLIPDFKPMVAASILTDADDLSTSIISEESPPPKKDIKLFNLPFLEEIIEEEPPEETAKSPPPVVEIAKEISHELPEAHNLSPARNPASNILFIRNLVRPFTLLQLKELLKQTGHFSEEGFWIDKIKSKCFVMYDTEEQAVRTRDALHGTRWPSSNPKILTVDFANQEELDFHKSVVSEPPKITLPPLYGNSERYDSRNIVQEDVHKRKEREERKKEKDRQKPTVTYIREWDKDKLTQESPERESKPTEKESDKGPSVEKRKEKKDSKRRQEEDTPAKLLDDLFQKTKTSPCIYWLPLTEEQAKQKEEERSMRQLEREKRWQQREQEVDRRNRFKGRFGREKENRRSQSHSRSRSPVGRRR